MDLSSNHCLIHSLINLIYFIDTFHIFLSSGAGFLTFSRSASLSSVGKAIGIER